VGRERMFREVFGAMNRHLLFRSDLLQNESRTTRQVSILRVVANEASTS